METLKGNSIYLRALEKTDLDFLYQVENNEAVWEISETQKPYSRFVLKQYLENSHKDIYEVKQLRLAIVSFDEVMLGFVDLYDYSPKNNRAGVGVIVLQEENRKQGIGTEALQLLIKYAFTHLQLHQLYANIGIDNKASIKLFSNLGFEQIGIKKEWNYTGGQYKDELLFQKINSK